MISISSLVYMSLFVYFQFLMYDFFVLLLGVYQTNKIVFFRQWYVCLGELQSLIPSGCKLLVLTATATKSTKAQIPEALHLSHESMTFVERSPNRPNIFYNMQYMEKSEPLETLFRSLICEIKKQNVSTPRTIIYCQTRKQSSVFFLDFSKFVLVLRYFVASQDHRTGLWRCTMLALPSQ